MFIITVSLYEIVFQVVSIMYCIFLHIGFAPNFEQTKTKYKWSKYRNQIRTKCKLNINKFLLNNRMQLTDCGTLLVIYLVVAIIWHSFHVHWSDIPPLNFLSPKQNLQQVWNVRNTTRSFHSEPMFAGNDWFQLLTK